MSNIATKLQSLSHWLRQLATHEPEPECKASHVECADDCVVAADEIHRLRMKVSGKDCEIARLREAFTPLADALLRLLDATEGFAVDAYAKATARTALARAGVEL